MAAVAAGFAPTSRVLTQQGGAPWRIVITEESASHVKGAETPISLVTSENAWNL
jgi:hypothetical protein